MTLNGFITENHGRIAPLIHTRVCTGTSTYHSELHQHPQYSKESWKLSYKASQWYAYIYVDDILVLGKTQQELSKVSELKTFLGLVNYFARFSYQTSSSLQAIET